MTFKSYTGIMKLICIIGGNTVGRTGGIILLAIFICYITMTVKSAINYRKNGDNVTEDSIKILPWWKSILFTVGGAIVIIIGGNISVDSATEIARQLGISEAIIGLTVVALGTSLPELVTSVVAARKGNSDIAHGNIVL